jgi:ribosomal protein S18 acetylase RimI-like enzyme
VNIEIIKSESCAFASALTQENMKTYYETRNIRWNPEQYNKNWEDFENFDIYLESKIVGVLRFSYGNSNCYIRDLQIESREQGRGIGKYCVNYAIRFAQNRGDNFIKLRVFSENPAVRLYSLHGFKKMSEYKGLIEMSLSI